MSEFLPEDFVNQKCPIMERYEQEERGNRGDFIRVNITMSPKMLSHLKKMGAKLQELGYSDTDVSSQVRNAIKEYLSQTEEALDNMDYDEKIDIMNKQSECQ